MATCLLYAVRAAARGGFEWTWRTTDEHERSERLFPYFHDCMADAQAHGHYVDLAGTIAALKQRHPSR